MKTIAFNRTRGSWITTAFVLGGLVAFYYYRRQGGKFLPLITGAVGTVKNIAGRFASAEGDAEKFVGSAIGGKVAKRARSISTSPEDLDRFPST